MTMSFTLNVKELIINEVKLITNPLAEQYENKLASVQGLDVWGYIRGMQVPEGIDAEVDCILTLEVIDPEFAKGEPEFWNIPCDLSEVILHNTH